jgi:hypothetical protein
LALVQKRDHFIDCTFLESISAHSTTVSATPAFVVPLHSVTRYFAIFAAILIIKVYSGEYQPKSNGWLRICSHPLRLGARKADNGRRNSTKEKRM